MRYNFSQCKSRMLHRSTASVVSSHREHISQVSPSRTIQYILVYQRDEVQYIQWIFRSLSRLRWLILEYAMQGMTIPLDTKRPWYNKIIMDVSRSVPLAYAHPFELGRMYSSIVKPRSLYIILTHSFAFSLFNFEQCCLFPTFICVIFLVLNSFYMRA